MVTFLSPIFPNNNSLLGTWLCGRLNKLTTILSDISSSSFFSYSLVYCFYFMYISASLNVCMCTMYVLGIYRGQKRESGRSLGSGVPGGLSHLSSSQGSFKKQISHSSNLSWPWELLWQIMGGVAIYKHQGTCQVRILSWKPKTTIMWHSPKWRTAQRQKLSYPL